MGEQNDRQHRAKDKWWVSNHLIAAEYLSAANHTKYSEYNQMYFLGIDVQEKNLSPVLLHAQFPDEY